MKKRRQKHKKPTRPKLIYRMLRWGQQYVEVGQDANERQDHALKLRSLTSTAAQFGYWLIIEEAASA